MSFWITTYIILSYPLIFLLNWETPEQYYKDSINTMLRSDSRYPYVYEQNKKLVDTIFVSVLVVAIPFLLPVRILLIPRNMYRIYKKKGDAK